MSLFSETVFVVAGFLIKFFIVSQLAFAGLLALRVLLKRYLHPNTLSSLYRLCLISSFLVLLGLNFIPDKNFSGGIVKVDAGINRSAITSESISRYYVFSATDSKASIAERTNVLEVALVGFFLTTILGFLYFVLVYIKNWSQMRKLLRSSVKIKETSRTEVYLADLCSSAFSTWFRFKNQVFIPTSYIVTSNLLRVSLMHEFQHIRNRDVQWVLVWALYKYLFWFSPISHKVYSDVNENAEFQVDQQLINRNKIDALSYGRALLEATTKVGMGKPLVSGAMTMASSPGQLKRRISSMKTSKNYVNSKKSKLALLSAMVLFVASVSFAAQSSLVDRRITRAEANRMAAASSSAEIPIVVTDKVMTWLNRGAGTERGRFYFRAVFKNMKVHEKKVMEIIKRRGLPVELVVIPFIESGFQNYDNGIAAGIWSITPGTGRALGLRIDDQVDERFDIEKSTEAALDYLVANYHRFGSWYHSMVAYNTGERYLEDLMNKEGHTDIFRLIREGKLGKRSHYLPKAMAGLVVLQNPRLVKK